MPFDKIAVRICIIALSYLGLWSAMPCYAQEGPPPQLEEFDNRLEGETWVLISGSANVQLLSLVSYFQDFEWYKGQELKIRFQLDETKPVKILAQQTKGNVVYRMKPKEVPKEQGLNEFGPWPVDDKLSSLELTKTHLGVTVTDSLESAYYPAAVYHSLDSLNFKNYLFQFLPGRTLTQIKFTLYKGLYKDIEIDEASLVYSRNLGSKTKHGGDPFQLFIKKEDIELEPDWQGWLTLTMKAKDLPGYADVDAIYFIYHSPNYKQSD